MAYLDFSKAFDKVPYKRLYLQLKCHGISGNTLDCIDPWLSGRQQESYLTEATQNGEKCLVGYHKVQFCAHCYFLVFVKTIDNGVASEVLTFAGDMKVFRAINPRPTGLQIFHHLLGERVFEHPSPRLSRLLLVVEKNEKSVRKLVKNEYETISVNFPLRYGNLNCVTIAKKWQNFLVFRDCQTSFRKPSIISETNYYS